MIKYTHECGVDYTIKDEFAGRFVKCKRCGESFQVPAPGAATVDPKGPPRRRRQSAARRMPSVSTLADQALLRALIFGGILLLIFFLPVGARTQYGAGFRDGR